ncbi:LOW QUALITY PROTEIN: transcriptional protein SWT1 [Sphaerodactylus townsendi]|uniref:LOW QUALITY PROTEIN: transcriptional protein SWT1 n=1 Tax=Sphaerodactylus townsendi TaxID=933632 RepID=UPI00202714E8|nr:LOW QUALITY PROTEIN: transcriptional protein SWT1 [Sphaerodactylus townsendi]
MSRRHKKKSDKKCDTSDDKHSKTFSDRWSGHSSSSSSQSIAKKYEGAEVHKCNNKVQPWSQRSGDDSGYTKTKRSLELKETAKGFEKETPEGPSSNCFLFLPTKKREKITLHFKNKAKHEGDGGSHKNTTASPSNEGSESNTCRDSDAQRRKRELMCLNGWGKNKKKVKVEHTKLKEIIVKQVLEQFEEASLPTPCSSHLKKKLSNVSTVNRPQPPSKKPYAVLDDVSGQKLFMRECKEAPLKTAKHALPELPRKSVKERRHVPSTELSKGWKDQKQKEQQHLDHIDNICNARTRRKIGEEAVLHINQDTRGLHHSCLAQPAETTNPDQEMQIVEDLHAARVDRKIVLPVVETCGELTSMEIDLPDEEATKFSRRLSDVNTLIVIDTNILISHLELIKSLKNTDIPGIGKFGLVIPWVVLQELDNLKKGRILANVAQKAVPAVHFIHTCLKNQDSKLWGQSMQLASQRTYGFSVENNDDRVLQCCLQYQELFPQAEVVLLTDDKNLCSKALVSEVKALCKAELVTALQKLIVNSADGCTSLQSKKEPKDLGEPSTDPLSGIIHDLEKSLGEVLSSILQTEMKIAYGDLWTEVVYRTPPWTLADLLECYKKHWIAVFGLIIPRSFLSTIEYLSTQLCKGRNVCIDSSQVTASEPLAQGNRHQEIWSVLENVWNTMNLYRLEVFQKLDLSTITRSSTRSSFKEAFLGLQKLMAAVSEILAGIQLVLMPNSSFQDIWTLYNFLTKNKINTTMFTAEEFYDCVSQGMYRERLSVGCSQLVELEHTIKQCYESVGLEARNRGWL